ncbi:MAG: hypothetical protein CM15mV13_0990 [uncultured marine virus]|nr:MAG: hypothetical protein CM15mV13_0990 [uncultured marine virus]
MVGFIVTFLILCQVSHQKWRTRKRIIEIKPFAQTQAPANQKRKTQKFLKEVATYGVNQAKWKAAKEYCKDRRMQFVILTENELRV